MLQAAGVCLVSVLLVEVLWQAAVIRPVETYVSDYFHTVRGASQATDADVVLIDVDDETLDRIEDPLIFWGPKWARAIETMRDAGVTVIGLDYLFKVSAEAWFTRYGLDENPISRTWDSNFRRALAMGGPPGTGIANVVLVASTQASDVEGEDEYNFPLEEYRFVLPLGVTGSVAMANVGRGRDDAVRDFQAFVVDRQDGPSHSLALLLVLHHLGLDHAAQSWEIAGRSVDRSLGLRRIVYDGPPGTHKRVPLWKLIEDGALTDADRALLKGRIALVGEAYRFSHDKFATPYSAYAADQDDKFMAGPEVHANIVSTLLTGRALTDLPGPQRLLLLLLAAGITSFASFRQGAVASLVALAAVAVATPVLGYVLFLQGSLVPVLSTIGVALTCFALAYPVRFAKERQERRFIKSVFERYVSDAVVNDILASPTGLGLGGARRELTVLFSDIRNFTTLSERMTPEEVVEMLNEYFARVCAPILEHGGVVDKFIGDAVMAVFGAPVAAEDHPRRAMLAALAMSEAVDGFQTWMEERFSDRDLPRFDTGIGVHSGDAVAGNIGFERRTEYTVIGDTVNTASRIEGLTKSVGCRILISRETVEAAGSGVKVGRSTELPVKGRAKPVEVFELLALDDVRSSAQEVP